MKLSTTPSRSSRSATLLETPSTSLVGQVLGQPNRSSGSQPFLFVHCLLVLHIVLEERLLPKFKKKIFTKKVCWNFRILSKKESLCLFTFAGGEVEVKVDDVGTTVVALRGAELFGEVTLEERVGGDSV